MHLCNNLLRSLILTCDLVSVANVHLCIELYPIACTVHKCECDDVSWKAYDQLERKWAIGQDWLSFFIFVMQVVGVQNVDIVQIDKRFSTQVLFKYCTTFLKTGN